MFVQTEFNKSNNNNELSRTRETASDSYDGLIYDLDLISRFCMPICSRDNEIREVALDVISKTVEGWLDGVGSPKRYQTDRRRLQNASNGCACSADIVGNTVNDIPKEYLDLVALHLPIILRLSLSCPFVNVREKCQHILEIVQSRGLPIPYPVISGPSAYIDPEEVIDENDQDKHVEEETLSTENIEEAQQLSTSVQEAAPSKKKKRVTDQRLELLKQSFGILKTASDNINKEMNIQHEEIKYYCGFIGNKMSKYSDITRSSVQHAINDIIFQADRGFYEPIGNMHYMGPSTAHGYPQYSTVPYSQPNMPHLNATNSFEYQRSNSTMQPQQSQLFTSPQHPITSTEQLSTSIQFLIQSHQRHLHQSGTITPPFNPSTPSPCSSGQTLHSQNSSATPNLDETSNTHDSTASDFDDLL